MKEKGVKQNNSISCSHMVYCLLRDSKLNLKIIQKRNIAVVFELQTCTIIQQI